MLVVQQADCEKIMHEVGGVQRAERATAGVCSQTLYTTGPHIGTTTNMVLINSSNIINLQYIISRSQILRQVSTTYYSTSNSYKTFRIPFHRVPKRLDADFEKAVKRRPRPYQYV